MLVNLLLESGLEQLRSDLALSTGKPVVVMGSAPHVAVPQDYAKDWALICMNGSQYSARTLGLSVPDIVILRGRIFGDKQVDREAVAVLRGQSARKVLVQNLHQPVERVVEQLSAISYRFENIRKLDNWERNLLVLGAYGDPINFLRARKSISAGVVATMLALALQKAPVIVCGISLSMAGHAYSNSSLPRNHVIQDRRAFQLMARRFRRIFTTDQNLSEQTGIKLWGGGSGLSP